MTWQILIPVLILIWGIYWFIKTKSAVMALSVVARLSVILGAVYLITSAIWSRLAPAGVCPLTTSLPTMLLSVSIPVIVLGIIFYFSTYFPQLIETDQGMGLLAGEDLFFKEDVEIEEVGKNRYRFKTENKEHLVTLRGSLGKRVINQLMGAN